MHPAVTLSSWSLDRDSSILRQPPRPPAYQEPGYEDRFDSTTVFCDAFWSASGHSIILVGPPLMNLERELGFHFVSGPANVACGHKIHHFDSADHIEVAAPAGTDRLIVETSLGNISLAPQPNLAERFRHKRVILTCNKDNDLTWIYDWALFHQRRHGCNAVLIYDNGSTQYTSQDVADALFSIDGLDVIAVIDWQFPWGALDGGEDSKFCQLAMLEHARSRCLTEAGSVLHGDIDELVLTDDGESVFELAERSNGGYINYGGQWVEAINIDGRTDTSDGKATRRHRDFYYLGNDTDRQMAPKWTCVPKKIPPYSQWTVHWISSGDSQRTAKDSALASRVTFRHFKAINTGWRVRQRSNAEGFEAKLHRPDHALKKALDGVFGCRTVSPVEIAPNAGEPTTARVALEGRNSTEQLRALEALAFRDRATPLGHRMKTAEELVKERPDDARLWNLYARFQGRYGDVEGAISSLHRAIELDATYAVIHGKLGRLYARQGRIEDAVEALELAVEMDPFYFSGFRQLSTLNLQLGRLGGAVSAAKKAAALRPLDPGLHNHLGNLLEQEGTLDEAIAAQRAAVELGLNGPGMHRKLSSLYAGQGAYADSMKCAFRALIGYATRLANGFSS